MTVGDIIEEYDERLGDRPEPVVLTLTEGRGFIPQIERFNKRLATEDTSDYKIVRRNDFAFNPYLLWAGAIASNTKWDAGIVSPAYPTFRIRKGYDPNYVRWLLGGGPIRIRYDLISFGAVPRRRRAKTNDFLAIELAELPPLAEQKRIAGILDAADALRAKRREALAELDTLLQATFIDLFGDPVTNPKGWDAKELSEVVHTGTIVTYGIVQAGDEYPGGVPYIRTGDIVDGEIDMSDLRRTDPALAAKFARSTVRRGEIVMSIRATVGTAAVVPPELDGANLTQGTARIAPGESTLSAYLYRYICSQGCQSWIQRQIKGATFREITLKRLREMPILVPPFSLQRKFGEAVEAIGVLKRKSRSHLAELDTLFASLQSRAFRGELYAQ